METVLVDIPAFAECAGGPSPFIVYVVRVAYQSFSWTVFRRYAHFRALNDLLRKALPDIPPAPGKQVFARRTEEFLHARRVELMEWLQALVQDQRVFQVTEFQAFLRSDVNQPPPGLGEIIVGPQWAEGADGTGAMPEGGGGQGGGAAAAGPSAEAAQLQRPVSGEYGAYSGGGGGAAPSAPSDIHRMSFDASGEAQEAYAAEAAAEAAQVAAAASGTTPLDLSYLGSSGGTSFGGGSMMGGSMMGGSMASPAAMFQKPTLTGVSYSSASSGGADSVASTGGVGAEPAGGVIAAAAPSAKVTLDAFHLIRVIGKGSFGKVILVRRKVDNTLYAMKVLQKLNIMKRNQVEHTKTERSVLGRIDHPFIVGMKFAFQSHDKLYFVLDYCAGGELFFHLGKEGKFSEERSRLYAAEIALGLQYLHGFDVIYRDLKPENVLLTHDGHIRLTDFGLSKEGISHNIHGTNSFCGTPEYLAPEILNRSGHGRGVDWWSLGALLYEMLCGLPPFYSRDRNRMFEKIRSAKLRFPPTLSSNAIDVLSKMLVRDPAKRLGCGPEDAEEIKGHPFFELINFEDLLSGRIIPQWRPAVAGSLDTSQFDREFTSMPVVSPDSNMFRGGSRSGGSNSLGSLFAHMDADQLKFPNFTYEAPSNMSDSASAFIEQLRAPPTSGEESGSASDFAFEATPAASAGGAAAGGLSNQFATVDEMDL